MNTATRERPILFSAPMVLAILSGRKTQTRRVVKFDARFEEASSTEITEYGGFAGEPDSTQRWAAHHQFDGVSVVAEQDIKCPYGAPGDRLWVRETWRAGMELDDDKPEDIPHLTDVRYEADGLAGFFREDGSRYFTATDGSGGFGRLRPSIFMPRWASRITLEVEAVRVERLHEMSYYDWLADFCPDALADRRALESFTGDKNRREDSARLWDSINGRRAPWDSNPWVWVVTFKRVA